MGLGARAGGPLCCPHQSQALLQVAPPRLGSLARRTAAQGLFNLPVTPTVTFTE